MFNINDIKNGITFIYEDNIYQVIEFLHVKPGKGAAFVKAKLKNLRTGSITEKTFNTSIKLEKAMINKQAMQYLYSNGDVYNFMNMETYEQIELSKSQLGDDSKFLKEGINVNITFFQGEMLGIELPEKIEYTVKKTEPAVKGNTTNNALKEAFMENDLMVKVPLFIEEGENIVVSTKDGKYDSRA
ncbi:MAG: elongation factor P [Clostridium sp.]|nr:elongation factor P [Clostridium sp.]MCM1444609.1 elongation factor P [Candidatus Amulumruptor caecigallinarius]